MNMNKIILPLLLLTLASMVLPAVFGNTVSDQFWLPGTADGNCHFQFMQLILTQGHGVTGTIVASNPIIIAILDTPQKQSLQNDTNACNTILTAGIINSGPTTNYYLDYVATYSVTQNSPFWIVYANVDSNDALVTINLTSN